MIHSLLAGTILFRVTEPGRTFNDVISGTGSYFTNGGRHNRVQQRTVYAATHPIVAIAEKAAHVALDRWQPRIGLGRLGSTALAPAGLPLVSNHLLWEFRLEGTIRLVNLDAAAARRQFRFEPFVPLNPSDNYRRTADIADAIRAYQIPQRAGSYADGILAPSVRAASVPSLARRQQVLFVPADSLSISASLVQSWDLELEFPDHANAPVTAATREICWTRPRFRLSSTSSPAQRWAAKKWHRFRVNYT